MRREKIVNNRFGRGHRPVPEGQRLRCERLATDGLQPRCRGWNWDRQVRCGVRRGLAGVTGWSLCWNQPALVQTARCGRSPTVR